MKFGFYVSQKATRPIKALNELLSQDSDLLKDIAFILNDKPSNEPLNRICEKCRVPMLEIDLSDTEKKERSSRVSNHLREIMHRYRVDYLFIFTQRFLKGQLLNDFTNRIINFHPSLLPSFKGYNAIDLALEDGAFLLGNTVHFINAELDSGPIIMQSILPNALYKGYDDVLDQQVPMLIQIMYWLKANRILVQNREVVVQSAQYKMDTFIPNLEIDG